MPKVVILVALVLFIGSVYYYNQAEQASLNSETVETSAQPESSVSPSPTSYVKTPTTQASPTTSPKVTESPKGSPVSSNNSDQATMNIETSCSGNHDNLGNHMDATVIFRNLDKLNSNDLVVETYDKTADKLSSSHVTTSSINNLSIPFHKYVYAFQGSTVPLELVPDGRNYQVKLKKATYKSDGTIQVYVDALETTFSKRCSF